MEPTKLNIVLVGDGNSGKTCLLHTYIQGTFVDVGWVYDTENIEIKVDGRNYYVKLHDTAGNEEFERIRKFAYTEADAFILCYSCTDRNSFDRIKPKWVPELKRECPNVPIILVATKIDLRPKFPAKAILTAPGEIMKNDIKAKKFLECSAKDFKNVNEVFEEAIRATQTIKKPKKFLKYFGKGFKNNANEVFEEAARPAQKFRNVNRVFVEEIQPAEFPQYDGKD